MGNRLESCKIHESLRINKVNFAPTLGEFLSILRKFTTIPRISKETTAPCADFIAE